MAITILHPVPTTPISAHNAPDCDSDEEDLDDSGHDVDMEATSRSVKRPRLSSRDIVTPGELITDDPQWMRGHGTHLTPPSLMHSTLTGLLTPTNKLLSITPLRARYTPSIGDLVIGRIVSVHQRQYRVDIASTQLAALPLAAINLPGGALRKRTAVDELNMRRFFVEAECLVAEVRDIRADGAASLHARSLRFGKLRNGVFVRVSGMGGSKGGVRRGKRQIFSLMTERGGGEVDVVLGVNGFVWVGMRVEARGEGVKDGAGFGVGRDGEADASADMYASVNGEIPALMRREIARVAGVVRALAEAGKRVDEDMVVKGYEASLHIDDEMGVEEGVGSEWIGGEKGRRVVEAVMLDR